MLITITMLSLYIFLCSSLHNHLPTQGGRHAIMLRDDREIEADVQAGADEDLPGGAGQDCLSLYRGAHALDGSPEQSSYGAEST